METSRKRHIAKLFVFVLPASLVICAGIVWVVIALWNDLMPAIFGLHTITYRQAFGLLVLSWILFRGFRGPRFGYNSWRHHMRERLGRMTPAEREEFFTGMRGRWGWTDPTGPAGPTPPQPETKA